MNTAPEFLNQNRLIGDSSTDNLVRQIFEKKEQASLYKLLQMEPTAIIEAEDSELKSFLIHIRPLPQWFDAERILKGQKFYRKFAMPIMTLLGGLSLPYCYAASPGNKALYLSDKMRKSPGKRLIDTAEFIITVSTALNISENSEAQTKGMDSYLLESQIRYWLGALAADCVGLKADKLKDTIVQTINLFQESTNFYKVDSGSFTKMMENHKLLKRQLSNL